VEFLQYFGRLPAELEGLNTIQLRQLADRADMLITSERQKEGS
jgi:hypothetical protein